MVKTNSNSSESVVDLSISTNVPVNNSTPTQVQYNYTPFIRSQNVPFYDASQFNDKYTVGQKLGKGGMGVVYEIVDKQSQKKYALKAFNQGSKQEAKENEVRMHSRYSGDNTINVYGILDSSNPITIGVSKIGQGIIMEYADGGSLYNALQKPLTPDERFGYANEVVHDIGDEVHKIHKNNQLHRDIKTENILVVNGRLKLSDFGIATSIDANLNKYEIAGTFQNMSPDIMRLFAPGVSDSGRQSARTKNPKKQEVYSFGKMVLEILAGKDYFNHIPNMITDDVITGLEKKLNDDRFWENVNVDTGGKQIIRKAMATGNDRYQSIQEFQNDWKKYLEYYIPAKIKEGNRVHEVVLKEFSEGSYRGNSHDLELHARSYRALAKIKNIHESATKSFSELEQQFRKKSEIVGEVKKETDSRVDNYLNGKEIPAGLLNVNYRALVQHKKAVDRIQPRLDSIDDALQPYRELAKKQGVIHKLKSCLSSFQRYALEKEYRDLSDQVKNHNNQVEIHQSHIYATELKTKIALSPTLKQRLYTRTHHNAKSAEVVISEFNKHMSSTSKYSVKTKLKLNETLKQKQFRMDLHNGLMSLKNNAQKQYEFVKQNLPEMRHNLRIMEKVLQNS